MVTILQAFPVPVDHSHWEYIGPDGVALGQAPIRNWTEAVWRGSDPQVQTQQSSLSWGD